MARRVGDQPAEVHHRLPALGRQPGTGAGTAHELAQPPEVLHLANEVSTDARRRSVAVRALRSRPGAEPGDVHCAPFTDVEAEREWVADEVARRYHAGWQLPVWRPLRQFWCAATPTPRRWPTH